MGFNCFMSLLSATIHGLPSGEDGCLDFNSGYLYQKLLYYSVQNEK